MISMTDSQPQELKKCPYCGRMTSAKANFCWWCARELVARPERPESSVSDKPGRIPWMWILIAVVILVVAVVILLPR
jgi:predicted amidophosphoribosyltransferase